MQIGSVFSSFPGMIQEECEEKDDEKTTEESQFFHDSGKDEIRFRYWQEAKRTLGPVEVAFAEKSAGSDGCFSIPDLIVSGKTEIIRVEECIDPVFLVSGQQRIDYWQKSAKDQECTSELLQLKTGAEDHEDPDDAENTAAAQIFLCNNKNIRQREEGGFHNATGSRKLLFFAREVRCQDQDKNQFGDLRACRSLSRSGNRRKKCPALGCRQK